MGCWFGEIWDRRGFGILGAGSQPLIVKIRGGEFWLRGAKVHDLWLNEERHRGNKWGSGLQIGIRLAISEINVDRRKIFNH